jgi:hypothetical protein
MTIGSQSAKIAIALITTFAVSQASAQSASFTDEEIDAGAKFDALAMCTQISFESARSPKMQLALHACPKIFGEAG